MTNAQRTPPALKFSYLKDCSFESPNTPYSFSQSAESKVGLALNLSSRNVQGSDFEVSLNLEVNATNQQDEPIFLIAVEYNGIFAIAEGLEDEAIKQSLLVDGPTMLYPYARQIVDSLASQGGFPALNLEHVDFAELYEQKKQEGKIVKMSDAANDTAQAEEEPTPNAAASETIN